MSIAVDLAELGGIIEQAGQAYLVTVSDDGRPHVAGVRCTFNGTTLSLSVGRRTRANAAARPQLTLLFPTPRPDGLVLLVDATAVDAEAGAPADDNRLSVTPTWAVLHKPAS